MTDCLLVYITVPGTEEAHRLCRTLVEERLAAGANVRGGLRSVYWWRGKLEEAEEAACFLQTTRARFAALRARVKELHSYETPCIIALPLEDGDTPFLDWIRMETTIKEFV